VTHQEQIDANKFGVSN